LWDSSHCIGRWKLRQSGDWGGCGRHWDPWAARPRSIVIRKTDVT
jgi:hypothetical protein